MKRTLKLTLSYDGTHFVGWQRQKNGRSVQAVLEGALQQLTGKPVAVVGAGRTDSGVHAEGQAAHANLRTRLTLSALRKALNALLPADLLVRSVRIAPAGFHARYSAKGKHYRYTIWNDPLRPLFDRHGAVHVRDPLDLSAMRRAARALQGRHDFRAFCSEPDGRPARSTVRRLRRLSIQRQGPRIVIDAEADGFLYHMVRRIVGTLIEVGKGKPAPAIPPTAPARGLCLVSVSYGRESGLRQGRMATIKAAISVRRSQSRPIKIREIQE